MREMLYERGRRGCLVVGGEPDVGCAVASRFAWGGYHPALLLERPQVAGSLIDIQSGPERHITVHRALPDDAESLLLATDAAQEAVGVPAIVCFIARPADGGPDACFIDHLDALTANLQCASLLAQELVPRMADAGGGAFLLVATDEEGGLGALVRTLRQSTHGRSVDADLVHPASLLGQMGVGPSAPFDFADACWRARVRSMREPSSRPWLN